MRGLVLSCSQVFIDFAVMDKDTFSKDDLIGGVVLPVTALQLLSGGQKWFNLRQGVGQGLQKYTSIRSHGELQLSSTWEPNSKPTWEGEWAG